MVSISLMNLLLALSVLLVAHLVSSEERRIREYRKGKLSLFVIYKLTIEFS